MWEDLDFQSSIKDLKKAGPRGHTLAHITPEEGKLLQAFGGSGRRNPRTKLRQYDHVAGHSSYNQLDPGNAYQGDSGLGDLGAGVDTSYDDPDIPDDDDTDTFDSNTGTSYGEPGHPTGGDTGGGDPPPPPPPESGDDGPSQAEIDAAAAAAAEEAAALEAARLARVAAGRVSITERLNELAGTYDTSGYGEAFSSEFADDLLEDYAAAQRGLDTSFLTSGVYSDFHGEAGTLADQQAALDALLTGGEQTSLDTQSAAYQAEAQAKYDAWLAANQAAIGGVTTEIDYDDFDFTDLDLSGYDTPTETFDPEFFQDYNKIYDDPTGTYFGEPGGVEVETVAEAPVYDEPVSTPEQEAAGTGYTNPYSTRTRYYTPTSRSTSSRSSSRIV